MSTDLLEGLVFQSVELNRVAGSAFVITMDDTEALAALELPLVVDDGVLDLRARKG